MKYYMKITIDLMQNQAIIGGNDINFIIIILIVAVLILGGAILFTKK